MGGDTVTGNDGILAKAATLRAHGKTWAEVAEAVGRAEVTVQHWPSRYAERWGAHLVRAIDAVLATYEAEALTVARDMLRKKDERAQGARMLLEHCRKLRGERMRFGHGGEPGGPLIINVVPAEKPDDSRGG